jgi:phage terminase large subunit-like protein
MEQPVVATYFGDIATQYARDVIADVIPACKWTKLACERHLADLERAAAGWLYEFNPQLLTPDGKAYRPGERVCRFAQLMPHIKGDWAARRELIRLEPWQVFALVSIFGWLSVKTGKRRFRAADLFVPRKNAKSSLGAVIGLYMLAVDGEFGAEVYSGATSEDQALEVFRPARLMARATPQYLARYGVVANVSNLSVAETNSKFEPVIGNPGDGASPSCAIVDEYHEHKRADLYDTMKTGMGARSQPLLLVLTTSGSDVAGPCYQHQVELQKVLEGVMVDEQRWGVIYTVDEGTDWTSEQALVMANPNFGVSVDADFLRSQQRDAIDNPRKQNIFQTKHLNIWVAAASPWLNLHKLKTAGDASLRMEDFRGETYWDGLDLASKIDIASRVSLFRREVAGKTHYYAFSKNYVPQAAVDNPDNQHYQAWVHKGYLTATVGNMISLKQIEEELVADAEKFVQGEVAIDAWGAREMAPSLMEQGFVVVDVPMTVRNLSEPMKEIQALIEDGRFHHDDNPAFVWMLSNVDVYPDRNANIFPRKQRNEMKIDAAVALILAMGRAMLNTEHGFSLDEFLANPIIV